MFIDIILYSSFTILNFTIYLFYEVFSKRELFELDRCVHLKSVQCVHMLNAVNLYEI